MAETNVILTPDQRVRVFISSTLEELAAERAAARRVTDRARGILDRHATYIVAAYLAGAAR
jgi:hypothetical protein